MPNQRFALPKPGFRCQNLRWAADILTGGAKGPGGKQEAAEGGAAAHIFFELYLFQDLATQLY